MKHSIEEQLILHEGLRLKSYICPAGKLTIGVGRNLDDKGITEAEAMFLLKNDIDKVIKDLSKYKWFNDLYPVRQKVIVDMAFNLGIAGLLKFKKMIAAFEEKDYEKAADEMVDSRWYKQVGERGKRLENMIRSGDDY